MSDTGGGRGTVIKKGSVIRARHARGTFNPSATSVLPDPIPTIVNLNDAVVQQRPSNRQNSGIARHGDRGRSHRGQGADTRGFGRRTYSTDHNRHSSVNNSNNNTYRRPSFRLDSATSTSTTETTLNKASPLPRVTYSMMKNLLDEQPDDILTGMLDPKFQLKALLKDRNMKSNYEWILAMTTLLEKITTCNGARDRIALILEKIPQTSYTEGVYEAVRIPDVITDQLRFDFIQSFLKVSNTFLSIIPHLADDLTRIFERIELTFTKIKTPSPGLEESKIILEEVVERVNDLEYRKREKERLLKEKSTTTTTNQPITSDLGPPPNDYRLLPIIPNVMEILSEKGAYLRPNIVDGVYEDAQQYLDIHFRLLREDFVGPLRDGIEQYQSGAGGKNFNVRIYENVRSLGPRLSPRNGIVYDLYLDFNLIKKITWTNSRRLIFGNLLVLTFDGFQTCAFVTVEDRSHIEKDGIISVKKLEKLNNSEQIQVDLDEIHSSYSLTMVETMTYFEAYRPVLNALQLIDIEQPFPLEPFLLKLTNEKISPDYVTATTTYDFTPLLVDPKSEVKASVISHEIAPQRRGPNRIPLRLTTVKEFRIRYQQANRIPTKHKSVSLLDTDQWPTSDELHLNPKQREALILALTNKVALIQGPPGTGKTYLGVRITEMLLHNRSVWCPPDEQSTPILMICHTNHALDQFLELIIKRLNINEGIIRVGNRCQNSTIQPFSLLNARRSARQNRSIPGHIYHQKHVILDQKSEAEEALKIHEHRMEYSRKNIILLSALIQSYIIDDKHLSSLLAPYSGIITETALSDWLGLGDGYEEMSNFIDLDTSMTEMNLNDSMEEEQTKDNDETTQTTDQENKTEENDEQKDTVDDKTQEKVKVEMNEEEEEEQRRRDELENEEEEEEEEFIRTVVSKPQKTVSKSKKKTSTRNDDNDEEEKWQVVKKKSFNRRRLIQHIVQHPTTLNDQTIELINTNLWELTFAQRHDLYRYWLYKYQYYLNDSVRGARHEYNQAASALAVYHQEEDYYILKDSIIVAMTTTCAAKYHSVLEKLQNKIVIVEEAAAIFESHIITALSTKCEHLILIGDHVQLRPNPSVYRLAKNYNIDISLFERLAKNNFPNVRLNIQHRMRPEIARIMKHFYEDLADHESVRTERAPVRGIDNNVYFINHSNVETTVVDGSSKRNEFEAKYVIALAQYLIKQGYRGEQITILVMYLGQRQLIAKQSKNIKLLGGVRIMVTDNYQGEENDIIILSLVRSNKEKNIGFLKTHNRICVALSRARCGLFVIGNMTMLAEVDDMWKKICKSLSDSNEIGKGLCLSCRRHSKEKFIADKAESFSQRPEGGCNKPCDVRLKCGHQCQLMCHNYDFEHREIVCRKKCEEILSCTHACTKRCHATNPNQHDPCRVLVDKTIAQCGHTIRFQCARIPTIDDCSQPILKRLPCDHAVNVPCRIVSSPSELKRFPCPTACGTTLACKHRCAGTCGRCRTGQLHVPCQQKCERPLICSHVCKSPCAVNCPPCVQACETRCIHSRCEKKCGDLCTPCKEPCAYKCKHLQCTRLCSEPCNRGPCNEPCDKKLKCGHDCIGICGEPCPAQCRICNKLVVQEIFFGTEDEPDARFVFLPDCKHLIEVTGLDQFVEQTINNKIKNVAIRFPECPRCKQQIRRCTRYMPIINHVNKLIAQVKKKILGIHSEQELNERRKRIVKDFEQVQNKLNEIDLGQMQMFFETLNDADSLVSDDILSLMQNIILFLQEINTLLSDGRKKLQNDTFEDFVNAPLNHIVKYLFAHRQSRNFAEQQIYDVQNELARIRRLIYIEAVVQSLKGQIAARTLKAEEKEGLDAMQYLIKKKGPFTERNQQEFDKLVKKFQHLNNLPGLSITEIERVAIVGALNLTQGHWYVCPNGHPYVITECGGANQESKCPECGEKIGGQNHRLEPRNRHFGLMDGSQHAAWSDEANVNIALAQNLI
ncbi:hypothetical protein I4U23_021057 [Adineta vaga]|nr:hypothetical protein I4U23_021057 [Adineta vaga]